MEKFYLQVHEDGRLSTYYIDEPFGYDSAVFSAKQEDKRFARDVYFSDGEQDFEFRIARNHKTEKLLFLFDKYGFEADVKLGIELDTEIIELEMDFNRAETDGLTYIKLPLIQDSKLQIIKRRKDIKVNLLSNRDLDSNEIEPCLVEDILLYSMPLTQVSKWEHSGFNKNEVFYGGDGVVIPVATNLIDFDVENSLAPFRDFIYFNGSTNVINLRDEITLVKAKFELKDIKVKIKGLNLAMINSGFAVKTSIRINYGVGLGDGEYTSVSLYESTSNNVVLNSQIYEVNIPYVPVGGKIWANISIVSRNPTNNSTPISNINVDFDINSFEITASSAGYSTVIPSIRFIDAFKYVIKSISGADVDTTSFGIDTALYNQRIFNGNFLRQKKAEPFYWSLKEIEECISEFKADYEIEPDGKVFLGLYPEYYQNEEIGFFNDEQFENFAVGINPRYAINEFLFDYKKYEKNDKEKNTVDSVHGESQWMLPTRKVENKHEVSVDWIRDTFLISSEQRKSYDVSKRTATESDDSIFAIDTYTNLSGNIKLTQSAFVQFAFESTTNLLVIRNDNSFSWSDLGIRVGSQFNITTDTNIGAFYVVAYSDQFIKVTGGTAPYTTGEFIIQFEYFISSAIIAGVSWTNQNIVTNLLNADKFANMRFSIKQNIVNYHSQYLAAANLYNKTLGIKNTFYKNNPDAFIQTTRATTTEKDTFVPKDPIVTPVLYKDATFISDMTTFSTLLAKLRTKRGFVRFIDNKGFVRKVFPKNINFERLGDKLTIAEGEEKYEPSLVNVISNENGTLTINNEYTVVSLLWEMQEDSIRITDNEGYLLYNPILWNRFSINGNLPNSKNQLLGWLQLL